MSCGVCMPASMALIGTDREGLLYQCMICKRKWRKVRVGREERYEAV